MISSEQVAIRLIAATILGSLIGMERGRQEQAAGLRTHAMVALGSCLIMIVSSFGFGDVTSGTHIDYDPSRVAAQVVSGIGFLGAGTIIMQREVVRGLTTAASIWAVAGIGLAIGGGLFFPALCATAIGLLVLAAVKPLERRIYMRQRMRSIRIMVKESKMPPLATFRSTIEASDVSLERLIILPNMSDHQTLIDVRLKSCNVTALTDAVDNLRKLPGVISIESSLGVQLREKPSKKRSRKVLERVATSSEPAASEEEPPASSGK